MDGFGFLLVGVFILLVMILVDRSKRNKERAEDRQLIRDLTTRIYFLEESVTKLKREADAVKEQVTGAETEAKTVSPPKPSAPVHSSFTPTPAPKAPEEVATAWVKATPPQASLKAPATAPPPPVKPVTPPTVPAMQKPVVPPPVAVPVHPPASLTPVAPAPRFESVLKEPAVPFSDAAQICA